MRIAIIGAGITGLTLAYYLKKKNLDVKIFEKNERIGGSIQTLVKNDFLFELGPRSCRPKGKGEATLRLIEDLNLCKDVIFADPSAQKRYILHSEKFHEISNHLFSILKSPFTIAALKSCLKEVFVAKGFYEDETIYSFFKRRFGNHIAENFIDPLISGIYAGDPRKLSMKACFPKLMDYEKNYGSLLKGAFFSKKKPYHLASEFIQKASKESLFSFKSGMKTLINALEENLQGEINLKKELISIESDGKITLVFQDHSKVICDYLFFCIPIPYIEKILNINCPIQQASLVVACLGFDKEVLAQRGFGYLIPHNQNHPLLGMVWDSCIFPQQNYHSQQTRLTGMLGGIRNPQILQYDESEIKKLLFDSLKKDLNIHAAPDFIHIHKYHEIIPQYTLLHEKKIILLNHKIKKISSNISCLGNNIYGVSVNDCVAKAYEVVHSF